MELEKFDLEKAKAGRKVVELKEPHTPVVKWDVFGDTFVYLLEGHISPLATLLNQADKMLALAPEERYVNLFKRRVGDLLYEDLNFAKLQGAENKDYEGTYKLTKV